MSAALRARLVHAGRRIAAVAACALLATGLAAHVGAPDTWFDGAAGPYPVRVVIRTPGVIPAQVPIEVRVLEGRATRVTATARIWNTGASAAPRPDVAEPVPGDPSRFVVPLWFMAQSSYAVQITIEGDRGTGVVTVPYAAIATATKPMPRGTGAALAVMGLVLVAGFVTLVRAAAAESIVPPGEPAPAGLRTKGRLAAGIAALLAGVVVLGGSRWWRSEEAMYRRGLYQPIAVAAALEGRTLTLRQPDSVWMQRSWRPYMTDHGKLMHLFLVREDAGALAHLHPQMPDSNTFVTTLPPLPAGRYRAYGEVVHESGWPRTLLATIDVPAAPDTTWTAGDDQDSWHPVAPAAGDRAPLGDGAELAWERGTAPLVAGVEAPLRFRVLEADGRAGTVEPYLGMAAHAVVRRDDGEVFVHLHPVGTTAMAQTRAVTERTPADSVRGAFAARIAAEEAAHAGHAMDAGTLPGDVAFPFAFPQPGRYVVWVQVRRGGAVRTAAFAATVAATDPNPSRSSE